MALPSQARVVIIGGGIAGCSVAYHLAKLGWKDVVLLERKKLTSGTTWHAAGLVRASLYTANLTRLAKYTVDLYTNLEKETGQATGFVQPGSQSIATNKGALGGVPARRGDAARLRRDRPSRSRPQECRRSGRCSTSMT
jgi:4-methylaminobutanoate oxidase (formaldehyde-forming)